MANDNGYSRRSFLKNALVGASMVTLPAWFTSKAEAAEAESFLRRPKRIGPNDTLNFAVIGPGGSRGGFRQGLGVSRYIHNQEGAHFVAACDVDGQHLQEAADTSAEYLPHRKRPRDLSGLSKNLRKHADGRYRWHWDPAFAEMRPLRITSDNFPERMAAAASGLTIPTLLVRGRMSDLLSEEGAQHFLGLVPHADFVDVSGAGHMVAGDRNEVFSEAVCGFLSKLRSGD